MKLKLPYEGYVYLSSPFGYRTINGQKDYHKGIDLVGRSTKRILAPCDGKIGMSVIITDKSNKTWEWGNFVRLDTADGYRVYMCHMARRDVKIGDVVKAGDPIGVEGNTGYSFGSHCHFELRRGNVSINPCPFLGIENKAGTTYYNTFKEEDDMTKDEILDTIGDAWIADINDLQKYAPWAVEDVKELIRKNIINGGTPNDQNAEDINMFLSDIKTIIAVKRMF